MISRLAKRTLSLTQNHSHPDVERKIPGSVVVTQLSMTAPLFDLPTGMKMPFKFIARMCYPYSTSAYSSINEVSKNELRISKPPTSDAITRASAGPVQMTLLSGDTVLAGKTLTLVYALSNVGGGFPTLQTPACDATTRTPDISTKETDKIQFSVKVDGKYTSCGVGGIPKDVSIKKGNNIACTISLSSTNPTTTHTVVANATYNYFITQVAEMTVNSGQ